MSRRLNHAGVDVRLHCKVDKDMLQNEFSGYEVIACNGAVPSVIKDFTKFKQWATADDILAGKAFPGKNIVILGGGSVGCETADYLAPLVYDRYPRDRNVTILEMTKDIMATESGPGRSLLVQRLMKKNVQMLCNARVEKVEEDKIYYLKSGKTECITDADTLIFAIGYHSDPTIQELLEECDMTYHMIGDAAHTGTIKDAIHDGYETARCI